ncbi:MAG: hypothetical protein AMK70_00225 [Nitrospira bacterium SG8_35_1]|nr:MAG: hypothetical protein AMK70_00225 [Nitrospira bacterium SG8_35_1]
MRQYHTNKRVALKSTFIRYLYPFYIIASLLQKRLLSMFQMKIVISCHNAQKYRIFNKKTAFPIQERLFFKMKEKLL